MTLRQQLDDLFERMAVPKSGLLSLKVVQMAGQAFHEKWFDTRPKDARILWKAYDCLARRGHLRDDEAGVE